MRIIAFPLACLFAAAAAVQINDPDPVRWIAIYSAAALVSLMTPLRRLPRLAYLGVGGLAAAWAALLVPQLIEEAAFTGSEIEREFAGLVLVACAMAGLAHASRRVAQAGAA